MIYHEMRDVKALRPHPENSVIFGDPEESAVFASVMASIKEHGIIEPLVVKMDGTILSGHLRFACAERLKMKQVPVRPWPGFSSYLDEVRFVIKSNTDRRQLSPEQVAYAFKRLKEIPREEGGAKAKMGRPCKSGANAGVTGVETREAAAAQLGVSEHYARDVEDVFTTKGVPESLKAAVNSGKVAPTTAAKEVRAEVKRQGGAITSPTTLSALAEKKPASIDPRTPKERVVEDRAEKYRELYARLVKAYREVDAVLTQMPLATLNGPTEHHEFRALIHDIAMRAWREVETVEGATTAGKQIALSVIKGGAK